MQVVEVSLIAYLGGHEVNAKIAREFILSLGGVALFGFGLRFVAQQGTKLLNIVAPSAGSAISSSIAYSGTYAIGNAAIVFYINGEPLEETKTAMEKAKKEVNEQQEIAIESGNEIQHEKNINQKGIDEIVGEKLYKNDEKVKKNRKKGNNGKANKVIRAVLRKFQNPRKKILGNKTFFLKREVSK